MMINDNDDCFFVIIIIVTLLWRLNNIVVSYCRYLPPAPMTIRQAVNANVVPGGWHIPAGTILFLSLGPMMRYDYIIFIISSFFWGGEQAVPKICEAVRSTDISLSGNYLITV